MAAAALVLGWAGAAQAAELVMYDSDDCAWCRKWHREVGGAYGRTEEGRLLPLRRVDARKPLPADLAGLDRLKYTPTFVVLACGRETGRITGYAGEDQFYGELGRIIRDKGDDLRKAC